MAILFLLETLHLIIQTKPMIIQILSPTIGMLNTIIETISVAITTNIQTVIISIINFFKTTNQNIIQELRI